MEATTPKNSEARIRANAKYNAKVYKRYTVNIKKEFSNIIEEYCKIHNISGSCFFNQAAKYCIDNNINLAEPSEQK